MTWRQRGSKYHNRKVSLNGETFDSLKEATRWKVLRSLQATGQISGLEVHPRYKLLVNGHLIGHYEADFRYLVASDGQWVVEDVKSPITRRLPAYRLKVKLLKALYGIEIVER